MAGPWENYAPATSDGPWAKYSKGKPAEHSAGETALDVAKSAGVGAGKGAIGLAGLVGDLSDAGAKGIEFLTNLTTDAIGAERYKRPEKPSILHNIPTSAVIQKGIEDNVTGKFYEPQTTAGKYAETGAEFTASALGGPGRLGTKALTGLTAGLGSEAAGQVTEGKAAEPYARVAGALVGGFAPSALTRAVTPLPASPARQRLVDVLHDEGVTSLTAGQRTGSKPLQYAESFMGDAPGAGRQATRIQDEGQRQFTEATLRRAGSGPDASPEVLAQNQARLGQQFEALSARNNLAPDNQFITDVTDAVRQYRNVPPSQQRAIVEGYIQDIIPHVQAGTMPGPMYQEMRSRLSRQANGLRQSDPTLSEALRDIRNSLDEAMGRSISPDDRDLWNTTRRQYGAQKTIEKAASRAGEATAEGQIVPANLRNTVSAQNRGAYARGEGDFSELARAGAGVMAPLPNSGTAQRMNILGLLNQATLGSVPATVGRALMSRPAQGYLGNQLMAERVRNLPPAQQAVILSLMGAERPRLEPSQ
jgi:hypothetical protein